MNTDARISVALPSHPKTKKLIKKLGQSAGWNLVCLFLWAASNRSDGDLAGLSEEDIELAADWAGAEGSFVQALVGVGFLDMNGGGYLIHDWSEHNPWAAGAQRRSAVAKANAAKKWGAALDAEEGQTNAQKRSARLADARRKGTHTTEEWEALKAVCGNACVECGATHLDLSKDHILAVSKGGSDAIDNIQPMCHRCNASKGANGADKRPQNWSEMLGERLRNACQHAETPAALHAPSPSPSPSPSPNSLETAVAVSVPGDAGDEPAPVDDDPEESLDDDGAPPCPHTEIIAAYHAELPMLRRVAVWNEQRQKYLRTRWREDPARQSVAWWKGLFAYVRSCPVLVGEHDSKNHQGWQADLEWIVRPSNFLKIIEGKYEKRVANA